MSIANLYFVPCIFLITLVSIIILLCFVKFKSLRNIRRRRNWVIYACLIILGLLFYQVYYASLGPNEVGFTIQKTQTPIYAGQENQFSVTCTSSGVKQADFYMVIRSLNATLRISDQSYVQVNNTAIKIPLSFHGSGTQTKYVYFTADANVSSLSFYPSIERLNDSPIRVWVHLSEIQCSYDPVTHSFAMADSAASYPMAIP